METLQIDFGDGRYHISNSGVVVNTITGRVLKQNTITSGYKQVKLWYNGENKNILVHRLVAKAFVDNALNLSYVNHIDNVKTNNHYSNLEWVTLSQNTQHSYNTGRVSLKADKHPKAIFDKTQVETIRSLKGQLTTKEISSYFKCDVSTIRNVINKKSYSSI